MRAHGTVIIAAFYTKKYHRKREIRVNEMASAATTYNTLRIRTNAAAGTGAGANAGAASATVVAAAVVFHCILFMAE